MGAVWGCWTPPRSPMTWSATWWRCSPHSVPASTAAGRPATGRARRSRRRVMADTALRTVAAPFVADPVAGVCIRDRLKQLTEQDETVLRAVGARLASRAADDLKTRIADGLGHSPETWAARKRELTAMASSRWAGSITKASHDQWALSRRAQAQHIHSLQDGIEMLRYRLSQPI